MKDGKRLKLRYAKEEVTPEGYYDRLHDHEELYEICIPISGRMLHIAGDRSYKLRRGDIFFVRPGQAHYAFSVEPSTYERFAFWIPKECFDWLEDGRAGSVGIFDNESTNLLVLKEECRDGFFSLLSKLGQAIEREKGRMTLLARFFEVIEYLNDGERFANVSTGGGRYGAEIPKIVHRIVHYVEENYKTVDGVDEISEKFYLNRDHITRVFKKYTGMTIHDYISTVRLTHSKNCLRHGMGVTDTAFSCGFNSTSYFIRVFSRECGMTPAKYRALFGGDAKKS